MRCYAVRQGNANVIKVLLRVVALDSPRTRRRRHSVLFQSLANVARSSVRIRCRSLYSSFPCVLRFHVTNTCALAWASAQQVRGPRRAPVHELSVSRPFPFLRLWRPLFRGWRVSTWNRVIRAGFCSSANVVLRLLTGSGVYNTGRPSRTC